MLQPKKPKEDWEKEKEWLQSWYQTRKLPNDALNKTYQKEKNQYTNVANELPVPNFVDKIDDDNTQGIYDKPSKRIDILKKADPLVYTHEGTHAINIPLKDTDTSMNAFLEIGKNVKPKDDIENQWIKDNYNDITNYQEVIGRLNSYRQKYDLQPDQEITPELIKSNRETYNTEGDFEDNTDQLYKLFEDEGLSNVLNSVVQNDIQDDTTIAAYGTGEKGTTMKTKKKYANGSSGVRNTIENPATTIAQNNIMIAQAEQEAMNNPWIPITMLAGQLASSAISAGSKPSGKKPTSSGEFNLTSTGVDMTNPNLMSPVQNQFINAMGNSNAQGEVEVEGEEVIELPQGQVAEVQGASHEKGGVNLDLPEGTKIYSKRIEKFGDTMAERKKARELKKNNLEKLLENNKGDLAISNAHKRTLETLEAQEQEDLRTQEVFGVMAAIQEFAYGTNKDGTRKYANGSSGIGPGQQPIGDYEIPTFLNNFSDAPLLPSSEDINMGYQNNDTSNLSLMDLEKANPSGTAIDPPGTGVGRFINKAGTALNKSGINIPGTGDLVGLFGDAISTFGPMKNTLANRAGDTPNVNSFADFGKDAIESNLAAIELAGSTRDSNMRKITSRANASKRSGRNSARGINQSRAMDLATDINVNEASQSATDSFTNTMMQLLGAQSSLENQQDQMVMQGEAGRDLADRQDRDNFNTQLGKDIVTQGTGVQTMGKDINAMKQNEMMSNVINQLSKYGLAFDAKGNLIQKPQQ